jgi:predicted MPP superfamily phosphohydrolase
MRNKLIEKTLQSALENGNNVWAIGDVHGFNGTLNILIEKLEIKSDDYIVLLGDLIDRGPTSYEVIKTARNNSNIFCVKGNHESMMINSFSENNLQAPDLDAVIWLRNGGISTVTSYIKAFTSGDGIEHTELMEIEIESDKQWLNDLPSHIILDKWRLVHAGYDPQVPLDQHCDDQLLWVRYNFHNANKPIDDNRTVVFAHTPTIGLPGFNDDCFGEVWRSQLELEDGRPASIGLDTCLYHNKTSPAVLSAINLKDGEVIQQNRIEKWNTKSIHDSIVKEE